jgi:hypothetical protein
MPRARDLGNWWGIAIFKEKMNLATIGITGGLPLACALLSGRLAERMGECEECKVVSDMPLREGLTANNNPEP